MRPPWPKTYLPTLPTQTTSKPILSVVYITMGLASSRKLLTMIKAFNFKCTNQIPRPLSALPFRELVSYSSCPPARSQHSKPQRDVETDPYIRRLTLDPCRFQLRVGVVRRAAEQTIMLVKTVVRKGAAQPPGRVPRNNHVVK